MSIRRQLFERLPGLGLQKARYLHPVNSQPVFTADEIHREGRRRGINAKQILSVGCQACGAAARWPLSHPAWFGHFANCGHADDLGYLQFAVVDHGVLQLVNPSRKVLDALHDEQFT